VIGRAGNAEIYATGGEIEIAATCHANDERVVSDSGDRASHERTCAAWE